MIEKWLTTRNYICGNELTIADLVFYSEVKTILALYKIEMGNYPAMGKWVTALSELKEITELDRLLVESLDPHREKLQL